VSQALSEEQGAAQLTGTVGPGSTADGQLFCRQDGTAAANVSIRDVELVAEQVSAVDRASNNP
jgi:hypothetical protein